MAIYIQQDGRLPPAYFAPSQFGKDAILKDENVFFLEKKNTFSSSYFLIFPTFEILFFFMSKKLIMRAEKRFLRNNTI